MAKHKFQRTRRMQVKRLWLFAALVWGIGVAPGWAEQPLTPDPQPNSTQGAPTPGQKKARATPVASTQAPAPRRSTRASTKGSLLPAGKRDPFKLPAFAEGKGGTENFLASAPNGVLPQGVRGLIISQLWLEGIVWEETSKKMIAVVTNETKRAYFLSENQAVYNGVVSKITLDAVYFKENGLDSEGRVTTRDVVKRLGSAPGEGR